MPALPSEAVPLLLAQGISTWESPDAEHPTDGWRLTPDVALFVGAAVVSVALTVAMLVFWRRISREETKEQCRRRMDGPGGGA